MDLPHHHLRQEYAETPAIKATSTENAIAMVATVNVSATETEIETDQAHPAVEETATETETTIDPSPDVPGVEVPTAKGATGCKIEIFTGADVAFSFPFLKSKGLERAIGL